MMRADMEKQMKGPRASMGRGYNREGFRGRGPGMERPGRPDVTLPVMPVQPPKKGPDVTLPVMPVKMKKGGMVSTKGNGCCSKTKPCKMS